MKHTWVVRIVTDAENPTDQKLTAGPLLECLRYAGLVQIHRDDEKGMCFDILCPFSPKIDTRAWAEMNARRMRTFLINAEPAPKYV